MSPTPSLLVLNAKLFIIRMHHMVGDIEGMDGYVDFCCGNQMSNLEIIYMAKELNLQVDDCTIWWLDGHKKELKEIKSNMDAL